MSIVRRFAKGIGVDLPPPKPKPPSVKKPQPLHPPPGARGLHVVPVDVTPEPKRPEGGGSIPPPQRSAYPTMVTFTPLVMDHPADPPPRKKPERHVPVLDEDYFTAKAIEERMQKLERMPIGFFRGGSASVYGVASYYGGIGSHYPTYR